MRCYCGNYKFVILILIILSFSLFSQENSNSGNPQYIEIDGEVIKLKKDTPDLPPGKDEKSNTNTSEDAYTSPKSTVKYKLKSKGMKIVELDKEGEPVNQGKRYAIVIGINDYKDIALSDLSKARYDAKAVGKTLKGQGQFDQVFVMTDDIDFNGKNSNLYPTKLNIEEKVDSVLRMANPEDMIVIFFSGHGISDFEENGYLVAVDTVADKAYNSSVKVDEIVQKLKKKGIKKSLMILDACRDVLYTSKSSSRNSIRTKRYDEAEVSAIFYSTKAGYYSYEDDESDYGVFTKYLIYGMEGKADENKDGVVSFYELEQYVQQGVKDWSLKKNKQQKPFTKLNSEKTGDLAITIANNPKVSLVDKPVPNESRWPYVWRSSVVPGWGQLHEGNSKIYRNLNTKLTIIRKFIFGFLVI
ncbi:MAG: caspase family protein [Leptospiraceae bacterium]|nr:caspase family protein [Leptospiraceae bacterium]